MAIVTCLQTSPVANYDECLVRSASRANETPRLELRATQCEVSQIERQHRGELTQSSGNDETSSANFPYQSRR
jgi:hypothetical protein